MTKQYLLMCDDAGMRALKQTYKQETLQFIEVQGMSMNGTAVNILVTPIIPPVTPMPTPTPPPEAPNQEPAADNA